MVQKKLSELSRDQLREELRDRSLPIGGSKAELFLRLQEALDKEGLDVENV